MSPKKRVDKLSHLKVGGRTDVSGNFNIRRQSAIYRLLSRTRNQELQTIIQPIREGKIQQEEMKRMVETINQALSILHADQGKLSTEIREAIVDFDSVLNSEISLQGKLELTVPIIPLLLDYKVELPQIGEINVVVGKLQKAYERIPVLNISWRFHHRRPTA
jgi:signal transduction histidine kinase